MIFEVDPFGFNNWTSVFLHLFNGIFSDTCGQDRVVLGDWFHDHGAPDLLLQPFPEYVGPVDENPYENPNYPPVDPNPTTVCGVRWSDEKNDAGLNKYWLRNFNNESFAEASNFSVTHKGHCGSCSYLQDLGVYIRQNLTESTRECGILGSLSHALMHDCLLKLGFSEPCVTIWEWNIINTKKECFSTCVWSYITNEPFNKT
ncbi:uncharacterized protein LOC111717940 [Eurytemora carolleeae]|uniref:uncharacterized protein LOC111717940 n=1 Tax=Eurytemora carolleeae TaxID=1294199 RepID=UPI000C756EE4|nr:uncharacterized protein LOC111717940 [Eurytemora carolleeae]|eukprot:XP_023349179.1 uncharacterized protein LOC111717940 [Eurytemora affinis]